MEEKKDFPSIVLAEDDECDSDEGAVDLLCALSRAATNRARSPCVLEEVAITLASVARNHGAPPSRAFSSFSSSCCWKSAKKDCIGDMWTCPWHKVDDATWGEGALEASKVVSRAAEKVAEGCLSVEIDTLGCWRMWTLGVSFARRPSSSQLANDDGDGGCYVFVLLPGAREKRTMQKTLDAALHRIARCQRDGGGEAVRIRAFMCRACYDSASLLGRRGRKEAFKAFTNMRFQDYERFARDCERTTNGD